MGGRSPPKAKGPPLGDPRRPKGAKGLRPSRGVVDYPDLGQAPFGPLTVGCIACNAMHAQGARL